MRVKGKQSAVYAQIIPAAPMWRAVYLEACDTSDHTDGAGPYGLAGVRIRELNLIGWGLVETDGRIASGNPDIHPLVWLQGYGVIAAHSRAMEGLLQGFVGIRPPRLFLPDFIEENRSIIEVVKGSLY